MLKELENGESIKILALIYTICSLTSALCIFGIFKNIAQLKESIKL